MKKLLLLVASAVSMFGAAYPVPMPHVQFFDSSGRPLAAGYVYTYVAGTTTPMSTFTDASGLVPNSNPIVLDASGSTMIWVSASAYKIVVQNKFHSVQWSADNVQAGAGGSGGGCGISAPCSILQGGTGATIASDATNNLQYLAPYTGAVAVSDSIVLGYDVFVGHYGADPTGTNDSTTAFQSAANASFTRTGADIRIPCGTYKLTSPVSLTNAITSFEGESASCVVINYTGTTGGPFKWYTFGGVFGNMTIKQPNATGTTVSYGLRTNAIQSRIHDVFFTNCDAAVGLRIDTGDGTAASVGYFNGNVIENISTDHCKIGIRIANTGTAPTTGFLYSVSNTFKGIQMSVYTGQTGFYLGTGWIFERNRLDLDCGMSNQGSNGDSYCVTTDGDWNRNITNLTGEYNNQFTATGTAYGANITTNGSFRNSQGEYNIRLLVPVTPGVTPYTTLLPIQNASSGLPPFWPLTNGTAAPSGPCQNASLATQSSTGKLYVCESSVWVTK